MEEIACPNCGNPIYDDEALLCHFCGSSLQRASRGVLGKMKYSPIGILLAVILLIVLGFFVVIGVF